MGQNRGVSIPFAMTAVVIFDRSPAGLPIGSFRFAQKRTFPPVRQRL
jgi:hypothetical protein